MSPNPQPPRTWAPLPKGNPYGRRSVANTATQVALWMHGHLQIPGAAHDALGGFARVHLFTSADRPGFLWLVPAEDDDETAYRLYRPGASSTRTLSAAELPERLGLDPDRDVVRGDWRIADFDQIVIEFPTGSES